MIRKMRKKKKATPKLRQAQLFDLSKMKVENQEKLNRALLDAAKNMDYKGIVDALLCGADVNAKDEHSGFTALMYASEFGDLYSIAVLIRHGANVDEHDFSGSTALMWAARNGYLEAVELLRHHGADLDACNDYCETALLWAVWSEHVHVCEYLISMGADIHAFTSDGVTIEEVARQTNNREIMRLLGI